MSVRYRSHDGWAVGGGKRRLDKRARRQEGKRCSGCLDTHKDRFHLSNEALVLNGPGRHRKRERKVFGTVKEDQGTNERDEPNNKWLRLAIKSCDCPRKILLSPLLH